MRNVLTQTDMGDFYRVPSDKRGLNYDKFFSHGDVTRNPLSEFDSNNTELLSVEEVKEKAFDFKIHTGELQK